MNPFRRLGFTTRLVLVAFLVAVIPIAIAYVAMSQLPEKVAAKSLDLALRETAGSATQTMREQNLALRELVASHAQEPGFLAAIQARDVAQVRRLLADPPGLQFDFRDEEPLRIDRSPVSAVLGVTRDARTTFLLIQRPSDRAFVNELVAGNPVEIALMKGQEIIASSSDFPKGTSGNDIRNGRAINGPESSVPQPLREVSDGDTQRTFYVSPIDVNTQYRLAVTPTDELLRTTIAEPQREITRALFFLGIASIVFALTGAAYLNRSVRRFSDQTRSLAAGDYAKRLPVHGKDAFALLAANFNSLAEELQSQMSDLESSAGRLERTLETIEEGVCLWNDSGDIELWNRGAVNLTDVTQDDLVPEHRLFRFLAQQRAIGRRRLPVPVERGGQRVTIDLVVSKVPGGGILQTFRDITAQELLQQTQRNFMTTAAHELRTPLTTILGFSQTLRNSDIEISDDQREQFLELIYEQAEHLQRLTDSFFDNQQLANERAEITVTNVYLCQAVEAGIDKAHVNPANPTMPNSYDVEIDIAPDLEVRGDFRAIAGIVSALVDNAHKYGRPPIEVKARRYGTSIVMSVIDHGDGIARQHHARLWDPFYRVDVNMRSGIGGAGLGLFTARKLVTAMRGAISIESAPGKGTVFTVEMPAAIAGEGPAGVSMTPDGAVVTPGADGNGEGTGGGNGGGNGSIPDHPREVRSSRDS